MTQPEMGGRGWFPYKHREIIYDSNAQKHQYVSVYKRTAGEFSKHMKTKGLGMSSSG